MRENFEGPVRFRREAFIAEREAYSVRRAPRGTLEKVRFKIEEFRRNSTYFYEMIISFAVFGTNEIFLFTRYGLFRSRQI